MVSKMETKSNPTSKDAAITEKNRQSAAIITGRSEKGLGCAVGSTLKNLENTPFDEEREKAIRARERQNGRFERRLRIAILLNVVAITIFSLVR